MKKKYQNLLEAAKGVLEKNWTGDYTKPAPELYPHKWNWDSAFIAFGYAHYDQEKAQRELLSLFEGQWDDGMIPHIFFNPKEKNYFPDANFWESKKAPQAPKAIETSGITQPPLIATATLHIYKKMKDKTKAQKFLREIYPKIRKFHKYLYELRDPEDEGLVYICHPWESGMDNSPLWDEPLESIEIDKNRESTYKRMDLRHIPPEERPSEDDYDRYVFLVELFKEYFYDQNKIFQHSPFLIQDVMFNSLLCRSNKDLLKIGEFLEEKASEVEIWIKKTTKAIDTKLWNKTRNSYYSFDLNKGKQILVDTASSFIPLFAGASSEKQGEKLHEHLNSSCFCKIGENCYSVPNFDRHSTAFKPYNYWRGPIWININWLLCHGLMRYGYREYAQYIKNSIVDLVHRYGFYEYFDPIRGEGYGSDNFSWSAALLIDVLLEEAEG